VWRMTIELTWDELPDDLKEKFAGDGPKDFASRALGRVRPALEEITGEGKPFASYYITKMPGAER